MTYTIAGPCNKDTDCLDVCPVDAIHPNRGEAGFPQAERLHINADICISCGSCFRACSGGAVAAYDETAPLPRSVSLGAAISALVQLEASRVRV